MATKKKSAIKRKPATKKPIPLRKALDRALKVKPVKKKVRRKKQAQVPNLPRPAFVSTVWGGVAANGRAFVDITTDPEAGLERLAVSVNGKGVWEGQP